MLVITDKGTRATSSSLISILFHSIQEIANINKLKGKYTPGVKSAESAYVPGGHTKMFVRNVEQIHCIQTTNFLILSELVSYM